MVRFKLVIATIIVAVWTNSGAADTIPICLAWDANTEPDLAGYVLYRSETSGGPYTAVVTLGVVTTYCTDGVLGVHNYWVITAFDTAEPANESGYSNEVMFYAPVSARIPALFLGGGN